MVYDQLSGNLSWLPDELVRVYLGKELRKELVRRSDKKCAIAGSREVDVKIIELGEYDNGRFDDMLPLCS